MNAPAPSPTSGWVLVAQFKGRDAFDITTRVFTVSAAKGPWRLTWLTYAFLTVEVIDGKTGKAVGDVFRWQSPGPPRVGDISFKQGGDFYLRISANGVYQIDIEERR